MPSVPETGRLWPDRHAASRVVPRLGGVGSRREERTRLQGGLQSRVLVPGLEGQRRTGSRAPLFAVRKALNGRIALLPVDPGYIIWNVGNPAFPQVFMDLGDGKDNPSSGFRLIENSLRWLAEPARSRGELA